MIIIKSQKQKNIEGELESIGNLIQAAYDKWHAKKVSYDEYRAEAAPLEKKYSELMLIYQEEERENKDCLFSFDGKELKGILIYHNCYSSDFDSDRTDISIIICPELQTIFKEQCYSSRSGTNSIEIKVLYNFKNKIIKI